MTWLLVATVGSILLALKVLLIPAYVSTDFEVHRNWLALTYQKPIDKWYTENTSEWTLDYPPFFAYFERVLAEVAKQFGVDERIFELSEQPVFSRGILIFQRFSVILTDLFYLATCATYAFYSPKLAANLPPEMREKSREMCFVLLASLQALLIIDSIHFQYNSMLTGIFLLSVYFLEREEFCKAGLTFSILINFKHIYIYYALGYVFYYLVNYFTTINTKIFTKTLFLGSAILAPFFASFAPFLAAGGVQSIIDILHRLFPISRGLTHAFWAPNFWALYNLLDLVLFKLAKLLNLAPENLVAPSYTNGLVQEYEHSVLPNVSPMGTLILVVVSSLVAMAVLVWRGKERDFSLFATISALCFFYFGYHVHEKAIILITVPYTIYAIKNPKFLKNLIFIQQIATFSIFPLLFTKFEIFVKYAIGATYFLLQLYLAKKMTRVPIAVFLPTSHRIFYALLILAEIYNTFIHSAIFGAKNFEFFPLLLISLVNAVGVTWFFAAIFWRVLGADETWNLAKCRMREELIKKKLMYSVQSVDYEEDVELVGGIDISASKSNADFAVISFSIFTYPNLSHLATFSNCQILENPYIPQFLAVREAEKLAEFIRKCCEQHPTLRPDVIFCDGFGEFHERGCGMACHVGALTGIATIGVAKNLAPYLKAEEFLRNARKLLEAKEKFVAFDLETPCRMNILRLNGNSSSGVFVSAGYGIELDVSTQIAIRCLKTSTTCEPIRKADLTSRELVRKYFD